MPVNSQHPQYADTVQHWRDCRIFYMGEDAVKQAGELYLPKPEDATRTEYQSYVMRAGFFPAMERTISGLAGAIDRKDPTVQLPPRLEYIKDNADSNYASLRQFSKTALDEMFLTGRCGILVERDQDGSPPYLVLYTAESIINWRVDKEQNLTLVVLLEYYYDQSSDDEYAQTRKKRYRVLKLQDNKYIQQLFVEKLSSGKNDDSKSKIIIQQDGDDIEIKKAGAPLSEIPFVFCNVRSITPKIDKPPLLDLVHKNAEHYRVSADYSNALYFTGNPILVAKGIKKPAKATRHNITARNIAGDVVEAPEPQFKISLGSSRAVFIPQDASIELVECSGHGVGPNRQRAEDIKLEMAVLGARLLESQRTGVEAAETVQLRQSGETSTLSNIVVNTSMAIRKALTFVDVWLGGSGDSKDIDFMLNNDFVDVTLNPQLVQVLSDLVTKEYMSWETFYANLAAGELTIPGRTADEERSAIEMQPPMSTPPVDPNAQPINGNEPNPNNSPQPDSKDPKNQPPVQN